MTVTLPLEKMTTEEKLQTMETLWNDLCEKAESLESPSWHKDILQERESMIQDGDDGFMDWESAKKNIRDKVS
jgi:hypothetical protein